MKFIKRFFQFIIALLMLFCGLVVLCAFRPEITERIAAFLYPDTKEDALLSRGRENDSDSPVLLPDRNLTVGSVAETDTGAEDTENIPPESIPPEDIPTEYFPQERGEVQVPQEVAGKNGYQPILGETQELEEAAARQILEKLGTGHTGDGLEFDARFYPYYAMLGETQKHLYRQIYANADACNAAFAPVENITADQLQKVFEAVYNDHPELFWLDTAYVCKFMRDGQCVEIDLQFNDTAQNLAASKAAFEEAAGRILTAAGLFGSDYEKERFVHDSLLDRTAYNLNAEQNQSAYSGLVNGQTVCAGYARAFQYLLQQLGIPCYYCTGYAGESHAWNIVALDDGYYNVDSTWDDTGAGRYDYFNKTDQDFADTHIREDFSVYLPACNGQAYREPEQSVLRSIEELGMTSSEVLLTLGDYYNDCYNQIVAAGRGTYDFSNVIEGETLLSQWYTAYETEDYLQGYMENAVLSSGGAYFEMTLAIEELENDRYYIIHRITVQ